MDTQRAALVQAVLEGVELPAGKADLVGYAGEQQPSVVGDLEGLPNRQYGRLDEVGELLTLVPTAPAPEPRTPVPESGEPPGGPDYLTPFPKDTGRVRHDAPRQNPPQQAIEQAASEQKKQKAEQGG
ncbi:MAG TPA: DUF2795 domain-containing protein [Gaiellaceae bacterium]|jgi:hypothetical protein|nr:DUF2795 domain-containing protein [Gaiellaceae bacterium]